MVAKINYQNIRNGPYSIKTNLVNNPVHKDKGDLTEENLIDGMMKHDIFVQMPPKSRSSYYLTKHSSKNEEILDRLEKIEKRLTDLECKMFPPKEYIIPKDWINWEREKEETGDYQCLKYTYL